MATMIGIFLRGRPTATSSADLAGRSYPHRGHDVAVKAGGIKRRIHRAWTYLLPWACACATGCIRDFDDLRSGSMSDPIDDALTADAGRTEMPPSPTFDASRDWQDAGRAPEDAGVVDHPSALMRDAFADDAAVDSRSSCIPAKEVCNGKDDDCNGVIDEGCPPELSWTMPSPLPLIGKPGGGGEFSDLCTADEALVGVKVITNNVLSQVRGVCRKYAVGTTCNGTNCVYSLRSGSTRDLPPHPENLTTTDNMTYDLTCPDPNVLVGFQIVKESCCGVSGPFIRSLWVTCATPTLTQGVIAPRLEWMSTLQIGPASANVALDPGYQTESKTAPIPGIAVGLLGASGIWVDRVGVTSAVMTVTLH